MKEFRSDFVLKTRCPYRSQRTPDQSFGEIEEHFTDPRNVVEGTLLAYRENAGKGEEKVLIWRFRRWKLNEEDDDEEPIFCLRFR